MGELLSDEVKHMVPDSELRRLLVYKGGLEESVAYYVRKYRMMGGVLSVEEKIRWPWLVELVGEEAE